MWPVDANFCLFAISSFCWDVPHEVKDTLRALVRIGYDGRVTKTFRGPQAAERFTNEVRVLRHLQARACPFVPRLLESWPDALRIVTTNCGSRAENLDPGRAREIFDELLAYDVRHDDAETRNITYNPRSGRFCVIDFEFATIPRARGRRPTRRSPGRSPPPSRCPTPTRISPPRCAYAGPAARTGARCAPTTRILSSACVLTPRRCITWASSGMRARPTPTSSSRSATAWGARWRANSPAGSRWRRSPGCCRGLTGNRHPDRGPGTPACWRNFSARSIAR